MKKEAHEFLFNEAIKYLGKYPATKKKLKEILQKKIRNKKIYQNVNFDEHTDKELIVVNIINKLDELKIINDIDYLESMFNYYQRSLFSIRKIKSKLYQKGFDKKTIDEYVSLQLQENPDLEINILKKYIQKKRLEELEINLMKKKLYQQSFSENSIYKIIKK